MLQKGKSIFLEAAERLCTRLGIAELPRAAGAWYDKRNGQFQGGAFGILADNGYDRTGWQYRLRQWGMRMRENSLLIRLRDRAGRYILESSVSYVGLWFLVTGLSLLILSLILGRGHTDTAELHACALLILLSVPLVGATHSLSEILRESRVLERFLFGFCAFSPDALGAGGRGAARPMGVLVGAALATLVGGVLSPSLLCVCLFLLPVLLLLLAIPELSLLLLISAFPILQLSAHPTLYLCLLAVTVHLSYLLKVYCGRRDFSLELVDLPVLLFCLLLALGGLIGYGDAWEGLTLSLLAALYFPTKHLLSHARWRRRAVRALLGGALACALMGIYQYFFTELPLLWVDADRFSDLGGRVTGVFENPNVLGIYLLRLLPMAVCVSLDRRERLPMRLFSLTAALAILFCAVLTWSRGAWLAILLELLLILLFSGTRTAALGFFSPLLLLGALPFLPSNFLHRFASIGSLTDSSIRYRLYTWRGVLRMIGEHPFGIGVGEAAFRRVYPQYAVSGIETVMHAHQVPLQLAAEMGIVGALTLAAAILLLVAKGIGKKSSYGCAYALCGAAVMGLFDHLWYVKGMIALFFVVAAFAAGEEDVT